LGVKSKKHEEMKELSDYYAFWSIAFGDGGIRKYVIDEIIPALNSNINYWLNYLIDNKLEIKFNSELEDQITKYPNNEKPFIYSVLSNGQKRRINLALSQAFAHVMTLNTGRSPSLVFLDEVSSNIDPIGVEGIYNMICELSKDKQVFVTTHDQDLLELLNGCQEINLVMEKGITKLV
jgi:DNA repair exonuclease SbcCD ATPase subunit